MLPVFIVGTSQHLMNYIRQVSAEFEDICVYKSLDTYPTGHQLDQLICGYNPEIILFEFGSGPGILEFTRAVQSRHPLVGLVGFANKAVEPASASKDEPGAASGEMASIPVLIPPFTAEEFLRNILQALDRKRAPGNGEVAAFMPSKGGSGATLTALNVARFLSTDLNRRVLLMEADYRSRPLSLLLNISSGFDGRKLLDHWRPVDDEIWGRAISTAENFDFLPAAGSALKAEAFRWHYRRIMAHARTRYHMVIVDLPDALDETAQAIACEATSVYIVSTPSRVSLQLAAARVRELEHMGVPEGKIRIVLNGRTETSSSTQQIEGILRRKIYFEFPCDPWSQRIAVQQQGFIDPSTALGGAMQAFAWGMAGLVLPRPIQKNSGFKALIKRLRNSTVRATTV